LSKRVALLTFAAAVMAVGGCGDARTSADPQSTASAAPQAAAAPAAVRLKPGESASTDADGVKVSTAVSDAKIIDTPDGWSVNKHIVVATALITVLQGRVAYNETSFTLVLPDGERVQAPTVASDSGLPAHNLGNGTLVGPDKAKGLVTFDVDLKTLAGSRIEQTDDPQSRSWVLS
jgi:hypothetical protein